MNDLRQKGVEVIESEEELAALQDGIVVIRSHGVAKHIYDLLEKNKITCVDATCPFVKKIHKIVAEESAKGKEIIIIGNENIRKWKELKGGLKQK